MSSRSSLMSFCMAALSMTVGGGVEAPIVVRELAGIFTHRPRVRSQAAGRSVSSLIQGAAHAGRCVQLAGLRAVGFSLHGRSVLGMPQRRNPEMFAIQGVSQ